MKHDCPVQDHIVDSFHEIDACPCREMFTEEQVSRYVVWLINSDIATTAYDVVDSIYHSKDGIATWEKREGAKCGQDLTEAKLAEKED